MSFLQVLLTAKTTYVLIDLVQKQRGEERPKVVRFDERVVRNGSSGLIIISIGVCLQPAQTCCSPSNSGVLCASPLALQMLFIRSAGCVTNCWHV
ncbi:uncharacterized protein [Dermacentor albipictus]|uniref:uncharacterized protein isoform X2 n=1 Tax=Dermacentor albipictus TaxID=60249 RepID=UPI0038FC188D